MPRYASLLLSLALGAIAQSTSNSSYDYIITGGGPSGIIVAERLAESGASVLLLERGNASYYSSGGPDVLSWNSTVTQYDVPGVRHYIKKSFADSSEYCTDTADTAGCILGGGTMVNQLVFIRPQEKDFDDKWPESWKWSDVAGAAERLYERNPGTITPSADGIHYDETAYTAWSSFLTAHNWSSVDAIQDPNSKFQGFSYAPFDGIDGLNGGPVRSYLPLAQALSNFELRLRTKVVRVVRNGSLATGVEVENTNGERQIVNLKDGGRVILSSGAFSTPRILFNSGIGPVSQIETVANGSTNVTLPAESDWISLPVGQNLKDHSIVTVTFNSTSTVQFPNSSTFLKPSSSDIESFSQGSGILTQGYQRLEFWTSNQASDGITRFFQGTCFASAANTVQVKLYLTHGLTSVGSIAIDSAGNTLYEVDPHLNTAGDKEAIASMIDTLLAWSREQNSTLVYAGSTSDTGANISTVYTGASHHTGTAKMGIDDGRINNGTSVVDLNTKVYGTDNIFVVDASFHPDLPTGNLQAVVMVAAEAAAAKILALSVVSSSLMSSGVSSSSSAASSYVASLASSSTAVTSSSASVSSSAQSHSTPVSSSHSVSTSSSARSMLTSIVKGSTTSPVKASSSSKGSQPHPAPPALHRPLPPLPPKPSKPNPPTKHFSGHH